MLENSIAKLQEIQEQDMTMYTPEALQALRDLQETETKLLKKDLQATREELETLHTQKQKWLRLRTVKRQLLRAVSLTSQGFSLSEESYFQRVVPKVLEIKTERDENHGLPSIFLSFVSCFLSSFDFVP